MKKPTISHKILSFRLSPEAKKAFRIALLTLNLDGQTFFEQVASALVTFAANPGKDDQLFSKTVKSAQ
jgi:hypothetical protein